MHVRSDTRKHGNTDQLAQASRQRPVANCENGPFLAPFHLISQNDLQYGEVDIIEGVHDNEHNQVAYHTAPSVPPMTYHHPYPLTQL